jgi:hypothetical protein
MKSSVRLLALLVLLVLCTAAPTSAQQFIGNDQFGTPFCSGPLGPGPCAAVYQYLQQQRGFAPPAILPMPGGQPGFGQPGPAMQPSLAGLPGAGMLPQDGQIVAAIAQQCGGNPACMGGAWGAVEVQRCRNGIGTAGGCFGPNGEIMKAINRVVPQNLQPNVIAHNVQNDIQHGPGPNNDFVGCNGAVNRFFGGHC